jgi:hypothetical protein
MQDRIKELKEGIDAELARTADKDVFNGNPQTRMELEISLLEQGCHVDQDEHGLLVNRKFIVAISKNKWCVKGKYVWYRYKDIPTLVEKYINKGERDDNKYESVGICHSAGIGGDA